MDKLFKQKKDFIIINISFDEYRKAKNGTDIEFQINESQESIMIHKELDKLMVKMITTIVGVDNENTQIFSFVLRSNTQVYLKEKLKTENQSKSPILSDEIKTQAEIIASTENKTFIKQFFNKTHIPISSDQF
ncbi:hypothetical protein A9G35_03830 [Gilliamella sp. Choc5-1]|uniref:hypothetical protein n=1 Tax=Gilliamella sp. Choc5-1 TaxID=3120238 RepID=UPI00080E031F|nr:hypothetical protein [Gilliamella apicola]OCG47481.1 hypothetical protein A9G35_03830 [Gilliamella apicola]